MTSVLHPPVSASIPLVSSDYPLHGGTGPVPTKRCTQAHQANCGIIGNNIDITYHVIAAQCPLIAQNDTPKADTC